MGIAYNEILAIRARAERATPGPWTYYEEGRDHRAGDSFIMTGGDESSEVRGPDIYAHVHYPDYENWTNDGDFIAAARLDIPKLLGAVDELWRLATEAISLIEREILDGRSMKLADEVRALKARLG